jgi:hypothetical protein
LSIEITNREWLDDTEKFNEFIKELNSLNRGIVITDTARQRGAAHMRLSNPTAFIRFHCWGNNEIDQYRILEWKDVLRSWYSQGLEHCYFFLHIADKQSEVDFSSYVKHELADLVK